MYFTGETARSIDEKQRISLPKEMRCAFAMNLGESVVSVVYASPGLNDSIWLWPEEEFGRWVNILEQSVLQEEAETALIRKLFSSTSRLELDKAGRIRLPEKLLAYAGIKGQAMLLGAGNHLEVVDASNCDSPVEELMSKELSDLIQCVKNKRKSG